MDNKTELNFHCDKDGYLYVNGIYTCQNFFIDVAFETLNMYLNQKDINIDLIIEIGTYKGGFTTFLNYHPISTNASIHTFDIDASMGQPKVCSTLDKVTFYNEDVFNTDTIQRLITDKSRSGNCLIFCDGGNKISEFNHFSDLLTRNDMIFAHDYAFDWYTFETKIKGKHWDYCEICYNDIEDSVKRNELKPLLEKTFDRVAWASFIKK